MSKPSNRLQAALSWDLACVGKELDKRYAKKVCPLVESEFV